VKGRSLQDVNGVILRNSLRKIRQVITTISNVGNTSLQFKLPNPNTPAELAAGVYDLSAQVSSGAGNTNSIPFAIAPNIDTWAPGPIAAGAVTLSVPCIPFLQPGQEVFLIIGDQQAAADPFATATISPSFTYPSLAKTGGKVPARLRVDGIDSPIIDTTKIPPAFSGPMVEVK
jgi:hypothetical protein